MDTIFEAKSKGLLFSVFKVDDNRYLINIAKGTNLVCETVDSDMPSVIATGRAYAKAFGMKVIQPEDKSEGE